MLGPLLLEIIIYMQFVYLSICPPTASTRKQRRDEYKGGTGQKDKERLSNKGFIQLENGDHDK